MNLHDRLHCPECKSRLEPATPTELRCTACETVIAVVDGIGDFVGEAVPSPTDPYRYGPDLSAGEAPIGDLPAHIRGAAGGRWPAYFGDILVLGCGSGQMTESLVSTEAMRGLLAVDSDIQNVRSCRDRLRAAETPVCFATLSGSRNAIRDAVADTVVGVDVLDRTGDVRGFLATVHRTLKPGGRAWFVVPNRRYHQALCHALAEALVQSFARDRVWPDEIHAAAGILAWNRLRQVHQGDAAFINTLDQKHQFDSEMLEDLAQEVGFATAEMIPLLHDPIGARTAHRMLAATGLSERFVNDITPLLVSAGQPFLSLLGRQDCSASMLLWLTKAAGPQVQVFTGRPKPAQVGVAAVHAAVGGADPRWSVELMARDTPDGIMVELKGWCLANTDVRWMRLTLDGTMRHVPVWRPRPDVHEVLNRAGLYNSLNTLCSGADAELLFDAVHAPEGRCRFGLDVELANGLILVGHAPAMLPMDEVVVINQ
jgi:2-polyprenyl-3-methyl-5-hydroxy-6-metoxy-1,4-benzoquinol methylase